MPGQQQQHHQEHRVRQTRLRFGDRVELVLRHRASGQGLLSPSKDSTGVCLWPCAAVLCRFLASDSGLHLVHDALAGGFSGGDTRKCDKAGAAAVGAARVIELGAGTGAPGLVCARLHRCSTLLTDRDEETLQQLQSNVQLNGLEQCASVTCLSWSDGAATRTSIDAASTCRLVLASDCLYPGQPAAGVRGFFDTAAALLSSGGVLLLSYVSRGSWADAFTTTVLRAAYARGFRARRLAPEERSECGHGEPLVLKLTLEATETAQQQQRQQQGGLCAAGTGEEQVVEQQWWAREWREQLPFVKFRCAGIGEKGARGENVSMKELFGDDMWSEEDAQVCAGSDQ